LAPPCSEPYSHLLQDARSENKHIIEFHSYKIINCPN
jgi:hypothetical protein